jgi:hypothetical protein
MTQWIPSLLAFSFVAIAATPEMYKLRFREGAGHCAIATLPESWNYTAEKWPTPFSPGKWNLRKDPQLPEPGYLMRWNGEYGIAPDNYSQNVFRFEWTGAKPEFVSIPADRWDAAFKLPFSYRMDTRVNPESEGDSAKLIVGGKRFGRTGKHWGNTDHDAVLSEDGKWLVVQSTDGRIVHETTFGSGPNRPVDGPAHIDVYHVPSSQRSIRLEIKLTGGAGLSGLVGNTRLYESRYLFLRVDARPQWTRFLVCKLPAEP